MKPYYEDAGVTIYHGDCRDVLPQIVSASVGGVLTSPPYNQGAMTGGYANLQGGYGSYSDKLPHGEYVEWQRSTLEECWRVTCAAGAVFYNHKPLIRDGVCWLPLDLNPGLPLRQIVTWTRRSGCNWSETHLMPLYEWVMIFAKPKFRFTKDASTLGDVWDVHHQGNGRPSDHPAPFPLGLARRAVRLLAEANSDAILDPFAGSGTTLRAARDFGRKAIGIEIEERYCEAAARRCAQEVLALDTQATTEGVAS